jgi:potassium efflux system protein
VRPKGAWADNLALVRFAGHAYDQLRNRGIIVPDPTEDLIDLMQRTVEARGARLVVGLQRREPKLEAHLRAHGIPHTSFDGAPFYVTAGEHWTPEGNAQVAKQYLALFAEIGMLQSLTTPSSRRAAPARDGSDDDQVLAQTTSVFSPSIWLAAAEALPGELVGFGRLLKAWSIEVRDTGGLPRVAAALFVVTVLATAVFIFWFWRQRRLRGASSEPRGFTKALSSFGVFLGLALATPLSTITLLEATETRMIEITYGFVAAVIVAAFGRAVALGLLAPDAPQRRLAAVDDATARSLSRLLVWATRALGALVLALAVHKALAAPAALTVVTNMLFTLVIGALLVHLLLSHRHGGGAGEKLPRAPWLYALGWLILGLIGIALVAGYPAFAAFVAERLVSILAVSGALYLLLAVGRALLAERFALDTPRGEVIAADFGVSIRWLGFAVILTYGVCVAVLLAALVLYIGPW